MTIALALLLHTCASDSAGGRVMQSKGKGFIAGYASFDTHWEESHLDGYATLTQEPAGEDPRPIREEFTLTHEFALSKAQRVVARLGAAVLSPPAKNAADQPGP